MIVGTFDLLLLVTPTVHSVRLLSHCYSIVLVIDILLLFVDLLLLPLFLLLIVQLRCYVRYVCCCYGDRCCLFIVRFVVTLHTIVV
jgi:hypothetical protein